jgi:hypothetical protein
MCSTAGGFFDAANGCHWATAAFYEKHAEKRTQTAGSAILRTLKVEPEIVPPRNHDRRHNMAPSGARCEGKDRARDLVVTATVPLARILSE